jgi:predicted kinase
MQKPTLIIVNGVPGSGKSTLAARLAQDLRLPLFSRDRIYEALFDALVTGGEAAPSSLGAGAFRLLYDSAASVLAAHQPVIVEGFFGRPDLRTEEFLELQRQHDFTPLQILCKADGAVLVERFLLRAGSAGRHAAHANADTDWLEQNRERLLRAELAPLALDGQVLEADTTTPDRLNYDALLEHIRSTLA